MTWLLLMQWLSSKCYTNFLHLVMQWFPSEGYMNWLHLRMQCVLLKGYMNLLHWHLFLWFFPVFENKLVWKLTASLPLAPSKCIFIIFMITVKVISFGRPLLLCFWNSMILFCTIRRKYFWTTKNSIACGWVIFQVWPPTHTPPPL